jgi:hypothetical protein
MAYSLRLPDALDVQARQRADTMGISLNSLICVALDAYLKPVDLVGSVKPAELAYPLVPMESVDALLAKRAPQPVPAPRGRPGGKSKRKGRR